MIQGNLIGTNPTGTQPLPNEYGIKAEVWLYADVAHDNLIGGGGAGESNIIAYNIYDGVAVSTSTTRISRNSIFGNGELGINLAPDVYTQTYPNTVTPNDPGDLDSGPNNLQNFPVITSSSDSGSSTTVKGTVDTQTPGQITIEVLSNDSADASGFGEGQVFQGSTTPDATGHWVAILPGDLSGKYLTATATDAAGNTSEFSRAVLSAALFPTCLRLRWPRPHRRVGSPLWLSTLAQTVPTTRKGLLFPMCGILEIALLPPLRVHLIRTLE